VRFFVLILLCTAWLTAASAETGWERTQVPDSIPWWSVNAGGSLHDGSGSYRLSSSVGQSVAGVAAGANYRVHVGFWNPALMVVGLREGGIVLIPKVHSIAQNYPNPFYGSTTIRYALPKSEPVRIEVFNITGQTVQVLVNDVEPAGYKLLTWDGKDEEGMELGCGVYFYRITTPAYEATRKMLLLR
jgi:hypothetical protein